MPPFPNPRGEMSAILRTGEKYAKHFLCWHSTILKQMDNEKMKAFL